MRKNFFIFFIAWLLLFSQLTIAEKTIAVFDIGTLPGGNFTSAVAINSKGMVIGFGDTEQSKQHAFIWSKKTGLIDIGVLPGHRMSEAIAINSNGDVLGISGLDFYENAYQHRAFIWNAKDGMQDLGTLGGLYTIPSTITENGSVIGTSQTKDNTWHAFIWKKYSGMIDLGMLSSNNLYSASLHANNTDMITGIMMTSLGLHPFIWTAQSGMQDIMTDHNNSEYNSIFVPMGINAQGSVIGYDFNGYRSSFIWNSKEGMQDLGTLPMAELCIPIAIDDKDTVIGNCEFGRDHVAFIWKKTTGMQKLRSPSVPNASIAVVALSSNGVILGSFKEGMFIWNEKNGLETLKTTDNALYKPQGINQQGQITGDRQTSNTPSHAFYAEYTELGMEFGVIPCRLCQDFNFLQSKNDEHSYSM